MPFRNDQRHPVQDRHHQSPKHRIVGVQVIWEHFVDVLVTAESETFLGFSVSIETSPNISIYPG